jgi:DNA invertase Pin-like site-specific DNA recombinase
MSANHSTEPVRAVAYYRMSSAAQENSIEQQRRWAQEACPRAGLELAAEFADAARPGHETDRRQEFLAMLEFCRAEHRRGRPVRVIVCWAMSRFSRSDSTETSWFIWEFRKAGIERIFTASGWIDFRKMEDRVLLNVTQDATNHKYVQDLAQATLRGRLDRARNGLRNGGAAPYAYRIEYEESVRKGRRRLDPVRLLPGEPAEVDVVRELFDRYAAGEVSLRGLAEDLNNRNVPPPGRFHGRYKDKRPSWCGATVKVILQNPAYLGALVWNRRGTGKFFGVVDLEVVPQPGVRRDAGRRDRDVVRVEGAHEPLVSRAVFDRVQEQLLRRRGRTTPAKGGGNLTLTGLLRCGHCQRPMTGLNVRTGADKQGPRVQRYVCGGYALYGRQVCHYNCLDEAPLAAALAAKIREGFLNPDTLQRLREEIRRRAGSRRHGQARLSTLRRQLEALEVQADKAADLLLQEADPRVTAKVREKLVALEDRRERAAAELAAAQRDSRPGENPEALVDAAVALMGRFEEVMAGAEPAEKRAVLRGLIDRVELFFSHEQRGQRVFCRFVRGLIYFKDGILPTSSLLNMSVRASTSGGPRRRSASPAASPAATPSRPSSTSSS